MKDQFDTTVRFRVPKALKDRLERIAQAKVKLLAEIGREAVVEFVEREEARLNTNGHAATQPEAEVVHG